MPKSFESEFLAGFMEEAMKALQIRPRSAKTEAFLDCIHDSKDDEAAIPCMKAHVEDFLRSSGFFQRWLYRRFIVPRIPWTAMAQRCRFHLLTKVD